MNIAEDISHLARREEVFARIAEAHGLPTYRPRPATFPTLILLILEQQVSLAAAAAMYVRLGTHASPLEPRSLLSLDDETMRACGFSRQKQRYARELASAILDGSLDLSTVNQSDEERARTELMRIPGIGRWTADNYLLWALGRRDVFPAGDLALRIGWQELVGSHRRPTEQQLAERAEPWAPRRSAAALLIWHRYLAVRLQRNNEALGSSG